MYVDTGKQRLCIESQDNYLGLGARKQRNTGGFNKIYSLRKKILVDVHCTTDLQQNEKYVMAAVHSKYYYGKTCISPG